MKPKKRLSHWKMKKLSFGGRLCLLNLLLRSIPLFYLSLFKIPKSMVNKFSSLQRRFLWEEGVMQVEKFLRLSERMCDNRRRRGVSGSRFYVQSLGVR